MVFTDVYPPVPDLCRLPPVTLTIGSKATELAVMAASSGRFADEHLSVIRITKSKDSAPQQDRKPGDVSGGGPSGISVSVD